MCQEISLAESIAATTTILVMRNIRRKIAVVISLVMTMSYTSHHCSAMYKSA